MTKADGSITHVINGEEKESGELPQEDVQSRVLNYYEYDAFGNTIRCEEQVHKRFRYTGEQYDILTGQYYLRARYYNPVIARFTQEDTYYGDGLNLYTYCQNNPVLYHDPTGHGTKENSPYSRKEQQYIDAGADPDTARLAAECYPDAKSKQDLYNKYKSQGYNATDAKKLANYEIVHGEERAKNYAANNVKKSGPDYTATFPRDNVNTDWRTQERVNAQRNAGAGKGNESGNKSGSKPIGATYEGTIYRSVDSRYDPLEMSQYTINSNHRYTESGVPGLHFSSGEKIVKAELGNYDVFDFSNRTMYSYDVRLTNMLDVSNPSVRSQLGISLESIVGEGYDVTHAIGRYAYSNGYNGIIAPSARADGGRNIILFNAKGVK
ncbi:RHS repeat-associated core domain-containing protein [Clostridium sp. AF34-10BH]|uniref:RHS repeat-associated core domain-containing protein n=1 Tax=Clostridium sp. AF34-10BH TaxID=2293011 RepID=UPI001FAA5944|nr:RHS repeat-associated core domain-containing protein [Clostridium sp. AF34-10BH]